MLVRNKDASARFSEVVITDEQRVKLKREVLTREYPLGPHHYEYAHKRYDAELHQLLFNWHPDHFVEEEGVRPAIVLGRRGAGKSSYLNNLTHKENVIPVPIKSWDAVGLVSNHVSEILKTQDYIDAERVADIWLLVFLTVATQAIGQLEMDRDSLKSIIKNFPVRDVLSKTALSAVREMLMFVKSKWRDGEPASLDYSTLLSSMNIGNNSLETWESAISSAMLDLDKRLIIMIDNPEVLVETTDDVPDHFKNTGTARWLTYAGLLTLLAHINKGDVGLQVRYCVPAEQYFFLQNRSSARLKDFANVQVLHWSSGEILSALAHRYMVFLQLHPENRIESEYDSLKQIEIYTRPGAFEFFRKIFGESLNNSRGITEDSVTYLLRHTQLLPRQAIIYINNAMRLALAKDPDHKFTALSSELLIESIRVNEALCATEVIDAYKSTFPEGNELMTPISNLPIVCTIAEIKKLWSTVGAKKVLSKFMGQHPEVVVESDRFVRFLVETGVFGKTSQEGTLESKGYLNALFEYTLPQKLHLSDQDVVAKHPIFCDEGSNGNLGELEKYMGVYPKGTESTEIDKNQIVKRYSC